MSEPDYCEGYYPKLVTDGDRRAAARILREAADGIGAGEELSDGELADMVYDAAGATVEHYAGYLSEVDRAMLRRLADLIDRPTCRAVHASEQPFALLSCSRCGADSWAGPDSITPYCPNCGAEVVG